MSRENSVAGFKAEAHRRRILGPEEFFPFFHWLGSVEASFVHGKNVWKEIELQARPFLSDLPKRTGLEIGYGGGANVNAACRSLRFVFGTDVHEETEFVATELRRRGVSNFELFVGDGESLPQCANGLVDLAFSFCVFGHLISFESAQKYLAEIKRVLSKDGIAVIYFTRMWYSRPNKTEAEWLSMIDLENLDSIGYETRPASVNNLTLAIAMWRMEMECKLVGLQVLHKDASFADARHDNYMEKPRLWAGQHCVVVGHADL